MENHEDTDDTALDPRIQIELEKLNTATDEINRLEVELDEATTTFGILHNECTRRLTVMKAKLGSCIQKARPYYEAMKVAKEAQLECQKVAAQFQRANEIHIAAKETVALAEQRFLSKQHEWQFDNAWQEMLNHATIKVTDAETQKAECGREHHKKATIFHAAEKKMQQLEQRLSRQIHKSRPYFEEKDLCNGQLLAQKERIASLQKQVAAMKESYASSLKELESISEEIHRKRRTHASSSSSSLDRHENDQEPPQGPREPGVGAELTPVFAEEPAMFYEKDPSLKKAAANGSRGGEQGPKHVDDVDDKSAVPVNCDSFYFEPKKSPAPASQTSLPLLDNLAFVRKSAAAEDGPEVPIPYSLSGCTQWSADLKAELDKCDLASLGSLSFATGSSAVSERGDEDEDVDDLESSPSEPSHRGHGALTKAKSLPPSPTKTCPTSKYGPRCLTQPQSPTGNVSADKSVTADQTFSTFSKDSVSHHLVVSDDRVEETFPL